MRIRNEIYFVIFVVLSIVVISTVSSLTDSGDVIGSFTTANVAPPTPTNFSVQDSSTNWDNVTIDTHDITPSISWYNGTDSNGNSIVTHICIANSSTYIAQFLGGDSTNCAYTTTTGDTSLSGITGLSFNSTNISYYFTLIPDDGTDNGTELNKTVFFIDQLPVVSTLNITQTHSQSPTISWSVVDGDNGVQDRWPADTLGHHLWVGNDTDPVVYYTNMSADNNTQIIGATLPWGEPGNYWANRTINVTIASNDGFLNSTNYTTTIILYDNLPLINDVQLVDTGSYGGSCQISGGYCVLTPIQNSNTTLAVRLNVTDTDNDCSTSNHGGSVFLCLNTSTFQDCDETSSNRTFQFDYITSIVTNQCLLEFTTNKTATDGTIEFFRAPGNYKLHLNVSSQAGESTNTSDSNATWQYGTLDAVNYSTSVTLGGGTPALDQWNDGTDLYVMTNHGNNILALQWNATDPFSGSDTWTLNGTDFAIDDDPEYDSASDSTNVTRTYINATQYYFNQSTGLERCAVWDCNSADVNETLDTYYHIAPRQGLTAGTYNTTILLTLSTMS